MVPEWVGEQVPPAVYRLQVPYPFHPSFPAWYQNGLGNRYHQQPGELTESISTLLSCCLQCFDTVGWASGRASALHRLSDYSNNKSLFSYLRMLTAWHCPHSHAIAAAVDQLSLARRAHSSKPAAAGCYCGQQQQQQSKKGQIADELLLWLSV